MKAHLIALSSAAVLTVYAAGYAKTRSAADQLAAQSAERRPPPAAPRDMDGVVTAAGRGQPPASPVNVDGRGQVPSPDSAMRAAAEPASRIDSSRAAAAAPPVASAAQRAAAPSAQRPVETLAAATPAPTAAPAAQVESGPFAAPAPAPSIAAPTERPPVETPAVAPKPEGPHYKDGHYYGMGYSRHGDIEASIWIEGGKISTASISKCLTRYPCDWIAKLPGQVVFRQSADVDFVSGATESVSAFYYAVLEALGKAQQ